MGDTSDAPDVLAQQRRNRPREPTEWERRPIAKYRKKQYGFGIRPDADFFALADPVVISDRSLLGYDRLYVLWQAIRNAVHVPGDVAEVGSYRGGSAHFIASAFLHATGEEVPMRIFDTFEGHPEARIHERDTFQAAGQFKETSYDAVREYLARFERLTVHKGDALSLLPQVPEAAYRLVHVDTDLYEPTRWCLDYFAARMSPGGAIVVDDYGSRKCAGVPAAVGEFLDRTDRFQVWDFRTEQLVLVRR